MEEHCSIGLVVTTDGSITEIPREDYVEAEKRAILDMQKTGKPFLIIINSRNPSGEAAQRVRESLQKEYGVAAMIADCQALDTENIGNLLKALLYAFPMTELRVHLPRWLDALEEDHPVKSALYQTLLQRAQEIGNLSQAEETLQQLQELEQVQDYSLRGVDLADGSVTCALILPEKLYYEILSSKAGLSIENDGQLLSLLMELSKVKQEYDKISKEFYYLGRMEATGRVKEFIMPNTDKTAVEIEWKLETPVREDIYEYIVNG
jgi:stage IV sporulation protein A